MLLIDPVTGHGRQVDEEDYISSDPLLTLRQAARILNVHPRTCREYVRRGLLHGRLINGRWRFRRQEDLGRLWAESPRGRRGQDEE